ncbi:ArnT family glycosyltransferase [Streptomyces guryensis]|uniref:Glycosyltransferase family 39 protein n=1 Tax=Streptomyces guryensis TaxID=2886947 RepID=A0A9Q3VN97_9ACTN|nr:glycosyltransferase family 39 protein [Streptomyces guryensis]MCD9877053.1 glycosyltransferase family 39 protein [Streptomyces guryensis]
MATAVLDPTAPTGATRRAPWRSPLDQPAYARPALLVITVLAAVLYAWGIDHSQYHTFYANAARSMTESWKAFFYGSFDPGNSITLDKLPGFLWPQAISARIFGFHPWALTLPQVIEGVAGLLVLYRVVRRWAGVNAALIAGTAFLVTPVAVGLFRTAVEDPLFTLCVLLAAEATQRAAEAGRLRPLVMAGVWVGIGFQSKMLEAWAVLPALALVYLISAPIALRRRLAHSAVSAVVMAAVSCSWMLAITFTPAKDRPYVDGTTNNSAFSMVVGYNFLNRFSSLGISAASTGSISATQGGGHGGGARGAAGASGTGRNAGGRYGVTQNGGRSGATASGLPGAAGTGHRGSGAHHRGTQGGFGGASGSDSASGQPFGSASGSGQWAGGAAQRAAGQQSAAGNGGLQGHGGGGGGWGGDQNGWSKMFGSSLASQTGWLYPLAAIAIACGLWWRRGKPRTDRIRIGFVMWGTWLTTYFLVFSAGSVGGHTYYMGVIAVPLAALAGGGMTLLWHAYRAGGRRAWVLPGTVAATAAWGAYIASGFPTFLPWLAPAVGVLAVAAVVLLVLARTGVRSGGRLALAGLAASLAAVLFAPSAWAVQVFNPSYGSSGMGSVGPSGGGGGGHGQRTPAAGRMGQSPWGGSRGRGTAHGGGVGGFGDSSGQLTAQQQKMLDYTTAHRGSAQYVFATTSWSGASPYILAKGADVLPLGGFTGRVPFPTPSQFQQLVNSGRLKYVLVSGDTRGMGALFGNSAAGTTSTTQITKWVKSSCTLVPASAYSGTQSSAAATNGSPGPGRGEAGATQTLYRCGTTR